MGKFKRYFVSKQVATIYEVYADTEEEALDMVVYKRGGGLAGMSTQKGYNTLITTKPFTSWSVSEEQKYEIITRYERDGQTTYSVDGGDTFLTKKQLDEASARTTKGEERENNV